MCQKGAAGAKEARRDRPWKEASGKLSARPAFSFPFCTSAQYPQGCWWPARRGIHKQLERPREKPAKLTTPAAARWLRAWHKGPPLQIWAALCTSHEFFKLYDTRAVKLWRIKQVFQLSVSPGISSATTLLETTATTQVLFVWVSRRAGMPRHQLPVPQEAEGAFVALTIDSFPAQSGGVLWEANRWRLLQLWQWEEESTGLLCINT